MNTIVIVCAVVFFLVFMWINRMTLKYVQNGMAWIVFLLLNVCYAGVITMFLVTFGTNAVVYMEYEPYILPFATILYIVMVGFSVGLRDRVAERTGCT